MDFKKRDAIEIKDGDQLRRSIRAGMYYSDTRYEQIGGATARAWRNRINDPGNMKVRDFLYLAQRIGLKVTISN